MNDPVKILLVDDHEMIREGIKLLLHNQEKYQVIGTASDGIEALEQLNQQDIDLVISDISMPNMDGIELTTQIKKTHPEIKVLVLSMYDDEATVRQIILAEADGYMLKNTDKSELLKALNQITNDSVFYSDKILQLILNGIKEETPSSPPGEVLSKREIEILQLVVDEFTSKEIGDQLFISPKTVETHRKNILRKTGQSTLVGLIKFAIINQLVELRD